MDLRRTKVAWAPFLALILWVAVLAPTPALGAPTCTIEGGPQADHLTGTKAADVICGYAGVDVIRGLGGKDLLLGGPGGDRLLGGTAADILRGGAGNDGLYGGAGTDMLDGGPGRNRCPAGARFDRVSRCRIAAQRKPSFTTPCWYQAPPCIAGYAEPPDQTPPTLYFGGVGPEVADASEAPVELLVSVNAADQGRRDLGTSGVAAVTASLRGPGGFVREVALNEDEEEAGFFHATTLVEAPQPGFYRLESVTLTDTQGNTGVATKPYFDESFGPGAEVYAGPDEVGPELLGFTISPPVVDTSDGPVTVTMTAHVSDPLAGARQVGPSFDIPSQEPSGIFGPGRYGVAMGLTEGDLHDGFWTREIKLPRHAAPGAYEVGRFDLYDRIGMHRHYDREELEAEGFPVSWEVAPPGDSQAPEVGGFGIGRQVLHAAAGEDEVVFFVEASDDLSGIVPDEYFSFVRVVFLSPKGVPDWQSANTALRFSGTELDGVWKVSGELAADAPIGTYHLTSVGVADSAGNVTSLEGQDLTDTGWDLTFENLP